MKANDVLDVLEQKHFKSGAYSMLREVRNGTGYAKQERYADGLVTSLWPSRGVWFGGIEVKVSRNDWKRELNQPAKSTEIQRFCSYWWIASTAGVVLPGEIPETWGHIEVHEKSCKLLKVAPKLESESPSATFVASAMRNYGRLMERYRSAQYQRGYQAARAELSPENVEQIKRERDTAVLHKEGAEKALERLQSAVNAFAAATGVEVTQYSGATMVQAFKAAQALRAVDLTSLERIFGDCARTMAAARAEMASQTVHARSA